MGCLLSADITERAVDALVNPANRYLQHSGGVAGAIVKKGGRTIQEVNNAIGFVSTSDALKARYGISAVGPQMGEPVRLLHFLCSLYEDKRLAGRATQDRRKNCVRMRPPPFFA